MIQEERLHLTAYRDDQDSPRSQVAAMLMRYHRRGCWREMEEQAVSFGMNCQVYTARVLKALEGKN